MFLVIHGELGLNLVIFKQKKPKLVKYSQNKGIFVLFHMEFDVSKSIFAFKLFFKKKFKGLLQPLS